MTPSPGENSFGTAAIVGLIILICIFGIGHADTVSSSKIKRLGQWEFPPSIEICLSAPVTKAKVIVAAQFWYDLGYKFGEIYPQRPNSSCDTGNMNGQILISNYVHKASMPGETILYINDQDQIKWAKIRLEQDISRILEHELGHALGWSHTSQVGHLMNPTLEDGGWDTTSIKNK